MIKTTLKEIRNYNPCDDLLTGLGKAKADDTVVTMRQIIDICGIDNALWCLRCWPDHNRAWRKLAVSYARQVQHLMIDQRSLDALSVADRHADGEADNAEFEAAREAAREAAWEAERVVARVAAEAALAAVAEAVAEAARIAAWVAAGLAAWEVSRVAADKAAWEAVSRVAADKAAWEAAWEAVREKQTDMLLDCINSM